METTEYQSRIEGLNGTALVLPLSAPLLMTRVKRCIGLAELSLEITDYVGLLTISWNVRAPETRGDYAHSLSLITVLLPVVGLKIR